MIALAGPCPERELLLHGLADGELDAANALAVEEHLRTCQGCSAAYLEILRQKELLKGEGVRFRAPASLRARVMAAIEPEEAGAFGESLGNWPTKPGSIAQIRPGRFSYRAAASAFSAMALAASLILFVNSWNPPANVDGELVSAHVRSLLVSHLTDVASSDQHTVKPWFLGKLDFAPPVIDLGQKDFPLIGGRLDYIGGRVVPALVYKRHGHVINLFIWPQGALKAATETSDGYHIVRWEKDGFTFIAVSDLNAAELGDFEAALRAASA
jgi:anti-sigma factor RsiW